MDSHSYWLLHVLNPPSMGQLLPGGHGSLPGGQVHITKTSLGIPDYYCSFQVYHLGCSVLL